MRRRFRRRLFWAGVLFGLVLLYVVVSALRLGVWARDRVAGQSPLKTDWKGALR